MSEQPQFHQPQFPPQYQPTPPPKKKSTLPIVLVIVGLSLLLVIGGCSALLYSFGKTVQEAQKAPVTATSAQPSAKPTEGTSSPDAPTSDQPASYDPAHLAMGESVDIEDSDNNSTGTITASNLKNITDQYTMKDIDNGKTDHGAIWQITIKLSVPKSSRGTFTVNPYDFYWETKDGERYDNANGESLWYGTAETLNNSVVRPGRNVKGVIKFDASKSLKGASLVYAPNLTGDSVAEWKLG